MAVSTSASRAWQHFLLGVISEHLCLPGHSLYWSRSADFWTSLGADLKFWWSVFKENNNLGQSGEEEKNELPSWWEEGTAETQSSLASPSTLILLTVLYWIYTACSVNLSPNCYFFFFKTSHSYQLIPVHVSSSGTLSASIYQQDVLPLN